MQSLMQYMPNEVDDKVALRYASSKPAIINSSLNRRPRYSPTEDDDQGFAQNWTSKPRARFVEARPNKKWAMLSRPQPLNECRHTLWVQCPVLGNS